MSDDQSIRTEIEKLVAKLHSKEKFFGKYLEHHKTDDGDFVVTLSEGNILLYAAEIKDAARLTDLRLPDIRARFRATRLNNK